MLDEFGPAGLRLWQELTDGLELEPAERVIVLEACRVADMIDALDRAVARDGATTTGSRGQVRVHPGVQEARLQRALLAGLLRRIDWPADGDEWDSLSASARARRAARARWDRRAA